MHRQIPHTMAKIYCVDNLPTWQLTEPSASQKTTWAHFDTQRSRLATAKSQIDQYYGTPSWRSAQIIADVYRNLRGIAVKRGASHCSNAWLKYWELYHLLELAASSSQLNVFFNAELPGAALCAWNHYAATNNLQYDWHASSYLGGGSLPDSYGLYEHNPTKWLMESDRYNGDTTDPAVLNHFAESLGQTVDLYSHDAGTDATGDFNNQETINAKIHLGAALAGLMTMRVGATWIAKQYTFFEPLTWQLIIIYASLFEHFYIIKPVTSRPYNSEIYLVGRGYLGRNQAVIDALLGRLSTPAFHMGPIMRLDETAYPTRLAEICRKITNRQIKYINKCVAFAQCETDKTPPKCRRHRAIIAQHSAQIREWLEHYPIGKIPRRLELPSKENNPTKR